MNLGPIEYKVARIDGDYAYLQQMDDPQQELRRLIFPSCTRSSRNALGAI